MKLTGKSKEKVVNSKFKVGMAALALAFGLVTNAQADLITNGFTFSVADDFGGPSFIGTHYHSNTGGAFGNPAGKAEVGGFFGTEEVRGLSEYNLAGLSATGPAFVTFNVYLDNGLFGQGGGPFLIDVYAYAGNNAEDLSDWEAAPTALIGSFSTAGLAVGAIISFDVNSAFDAALLDGAVRDSLAAERPQHQRPGLHVRQFPPDDRQPVYWHGLLRSRAGLRRFARTRSRRSRIRRAPPALINSTPVRTRPRGGFSTFLPGRTATNTARFGAIGWRPARAGSAPTR